MSGQFQIKLDKPLPIYNLVLKIYKAEGATSIELEILKNKLISEFKSNLYVLPQIDFVSHGSLTADGTKSKLIKKNY